MIPLTDEENKSFEKEKFATYAKKNVVLMKMIKMHLNYTIKITVITLDNLEDLLIVLVI